LMDSLPAASAYVTLGLAPEVEMSPGHGGWDRGLGLARGDALGWVRIVPTMLPAQDRGEGSTLPPITTHRLGGTCAMDLPGSASPVTSRPAAPTPYGRRCAPAESGRLRGLGGCTPDSRTALISSPSDHARAPRPSPGHPRTESAFTEACHSETSITGIVSGVGSPVLVGTRRSRRSSRSSGGSLKLEPDRWRFTRLYEHPHGITLGLARTPRPVPTSRQAESVFRRIRI